jgi:hypothetical protein
MSSAYLPPGYLTRGFPDSHAVDQQMLRGQREDLAVGGHL